MRQKFTENFQQGRESSSQLCVYVGEEKVVDLWGSVTDKVTGGFCKDASITHPGLHRGHHHQRV